MKHTRQELGSFCHQFDISTKKPSCSGNYSKPKTYSSQKPPYKRQTHRYRKQFHSKPEQTYYKKNPYEDTFLEKHIPTKARPIQMNANLEQHCKLEIQDLESKCLIQKSRSPWSCSAFYVNKNSEIERGTPRLVINCNL